MKSTHLAAPLLAAAALFTALPTAAAAPLGEFTADEQILLKESSGPYESSECVAFEPKNKEHVQAAIECSDGKLGSPEETVYLLYRTSAALDGTFDANLEASTVEPTCPGLSKNPTTWSLVSAPDDTAGRLACATYEGSPVVFWSNNSSLVMAVAKNGTDHAEMIEWWKDQG